MDNKALDVIKNVVRKSYEYEKAIEDCKKMITSEIKQILDGTELPGVNRVSNSPFIAIVNFSTIMENKSVLSAEYYISEKQTKELIKKINNKNSISEIKTFIETVVKNGFIKTESNNKMLINNAVRQKLEDILNML